MPLCGFCRKKISVPDSKKQVVLKDPEGRIKGYRHLKCDLAAKKRERYVAEGRVNVPDPYTAKAAHLNADDVAAEYLERKRLAEERRAELEAMREHKLREIAMLELPHDEIGLMSIERLIEEASQEAALAARQVEIAEERAKEDARAGQGDWREEDTAEI